ncbi:MAG: hypothetical protein ACYDG2_00270 [Ruminiclostridium sp.]
MFQLLINFVKDNRDELPELPETEIAPLDNGQTQTTRELSDRHFRRIDFWSDFVEYCKSNGLGKPPVTNSFRDRRLLC